MSHPITIDIDGQTFMAYAGDRLLDAALLGGFAMPNNCRAGRCGSCVVRLVAGRIEGGEANQPGHFHACKGIVRSNLKLSLAQATAGAPRAQQARGVVAQITDLTHDVVEVTVATDAATPFPWRPGQYAQVTFSGFPARAFSPTMALDGTDRAGSFRLHVKRIEGGQVSSAIGRRIRPGHALALDGPLGQPALQPGFPGRMVLVSSGTGFAPMWAIADAALRETPSRRMVVVAGVDALENLYMAEALERLSVCPNVVIMPVTAEPQTYTPKIRSGALIDYASMIGPGDRVHAAGSPELLQALGAYARHIGASFHANPFSPAAAAEDRWLSQIAAQFASPTAHFAATVAGARR